MRRTRCRLLALAGLALLSAELALRAAPLAPAQPPQPLRIALPVGPQSALLQIASAKGFFAAEGLDVVLQGASSGRAALGQLAAGAADLAAATDVPVALELVRGAEFAVIASLLEFPGGPQVIARRDRGVAQASDLRGKRIGVTLGSSADYGLWVYLLRNRVDPASVTLVDLAATQTAAQIAGAAVDAVALWKPQSFEAQAALGSNALALPVDPDQSQSFFLLARSELVKSRPGVIARATRALLRAEDFERANPRQALQLVLLWTGSDAAATLATTSGWKARVQLRQAHIVALEEQARWAMARGFGGGAPLPNLLPRFHLDALLATRPERVTVLH